MLNFRSILNWQNTSISGKEGFYCLRKAEVFFVYYLRI